MKSLPTTLLATLLVAAPGAAFAADSARLETHDSKGWINAFGRVGGYYALVSGEVPQSIDPVSGNPVGTKFKRSGPGIDFDLMGYWDKTRFDTLLGAEMKMQFGMLSGPDLAVGGREPNTSNRFTFRWDAAFDYGLVHLGSKDGVRARLAGGAGFGADYDGGRSYNTGGRAYAILLARAHLFLTDDFGGHLAYHWIPTTTNDKRVREHRFEIAGSISALQAGLRYDITYAYLADENVFKATQLSFFAAYAF